MALPDEDPDADGTRFVFDLRFPGQRYDAVTGLYYNRAGLSGGSAG